MKTKRIFLIGCSLFFAAIVSLATDFGTGGIVTTDFANQTDIIESVAIQSDGKILVSGTAQNGGNDDFGVARYNTDGSLDTDFSSDGKVTTQVDEGGTDNGNSIAIQSDGKIVVGGHAHPGSTWDFAIVRYNSNGSLDTGFGSGGKVLTAVGSSDDLGYSIAVQSDGKIILAGSMHNGSNWDFALVRYNADGSLDTGFDDDGKVTTSIGSSHDFGRSVALQSDGKILVAGDSDNSSNRDFALVRYNTDGSLDTDFSSDGKVTTSIGSDDEYSYSVVSQTDGKILVAGLADMDASASINNDFALVRYNTDGSLDTGFDSDGIVTTAIGSDNEYSYSVVTQTDGKILVGGHADMDASASINYDFALVRYNTDGSLDTGFDSDGIVTTAIGSGDDNGKSIAILSDGNILLAGSSKNGTYSDFALVRYIQTDGSLPVELSNFSSRITRSGSITLTWVTESEIENLGFILERRTNKIKWQEIASYLTHPELIGQGSVSHSTEYSYEDKSVLPGMIYDYRLADVSYYGHKEYHYPEDKNEQVLVLPMDFILNQAYPNPFNPSTTICYRLPEDVDASLLIYDMQGRLVQTLQSGHQAAGWYNVVWNGQMFDGRATSAGTYFARLVAGDHNKVTKLLYLK